MTAVLAGNVDLMCDETVDPSEREAYCEPAVRPALRQWLRQAFAGTVRVSEASPRRDTNYSALKVVRLRTSSGAEVGLATSAVSRNGQPKMRYPITTALIASFEVVGARRRPTGNPAERSLEGLAAGRAVLERAGVPGIPDQRGGIFGWEEFRQREERRAMVLRSRSRRDRM